MESLIKDYNTMSVKELEEEISNGTIDWCTALRVREEFPENLLEENLDKLDFSRVARYQHNLSENFIEKYIDKFDLNLLCRHHRLSEIFLRKHFKRIAPNLLCRYQDLSEQFYEEYKDILEPYDYLIMLHRHDNFI